MDFAGEWSVQTFRKKMKKPIPFNKPFIAGKELYYIAQAVTFGNIAGDGYFTQRCSALLEEQCGIHKVLMTPSCTAALEMAAMLCELGPGDEVILPSYTFVSTANAVVRVGATPVFVDIRSDTLNLNEQLIEKAVTQKTKVIIPVHYAGVGCEMDRIMDIAHTHNLYVVEDAAQGVGAGYKGKKLGSIGHLGTYSFHETKNYICGEGGALCINDPRLVKRAEILRDKGTNRKEFFRGEVDKYTWVDVGSSYVPSEIACAFLYAQLETMETIEERRRSIYQKYRQSLMLLEAQGVLSLPKIPDHCESNYHMFFILLKDMEMRNALMEYLKGKGIMAVFHFVPLHCSPMGKRLGRHSGELPVTEELSSRLLRLPFYYEMGDEELETVVQEINNFFEERFQFSFESTALSSPMHF